MHSGTVMLSSECHSAQYLGYRLETITGMEIAGIPQNPRGWKIMLQDSCGDGKKCHRAPAGMEQNCAGFPQECTLYLTLMVHQQQQKFVFKLLNNVFSDFTDTNCIIIS